MYEYRKRKPTSKGLLARVKCAILSVFPKPRESVSLKKILLCCWFHYFPVLSRFPKPFRKPSSSSGHNTPLPLEFPSNGIEVKTERTRLHTNWHFTRTVYHRSLILRSFMANPKLTEDDANGFVKALCQFPHLWILHSRSQSPPSFWPVAGNESSGRTRFSEYAQSIRFVFSTNQIWWEVRESRTSGVRPTQNSRSLPQVRRIEGSWDENVNS